MAEADILALTYFCKMTIKRSISIKNEETGVTDFNESLVIAEDVPCGLNGNIPNVIDTDITSSISAFELYCRPEVDLIVGDILDITLENGNVETFIASKPFPYSSHLQVNLTLKERY
ncbi:TPA: hypothetical protein KN342_003565 [Clostridioides difficile]|uniref:hypothetical protein n=1 Tax=Clostridioides difficile TaxID=1496 RepID=UPI001027043B|nr:hypothetical protein [Clostridioides difficile]VFE15622.1 Uncharacterised protein [Clostridioides difficile]VIB32652.1 Uncharacterised protein [Clostridioides difficile]VIB45484.1 Uncharacterised protein [Clostridioides difficile]HBF2755649.1 hypothetical protein [Clostridioides difficile]HBF2964547.1 hypothetical protein [Clostridioides difficile]